MAMNFYTNLKMVFQARTRLVDLASCHKAALRLVVLAGFFSTLTGVQGAHGQEANIPSRLQGAELDERSGSEKGRLPEQCLKLRSNGAVIQQSSYSKSVAPGSGVMQFTTPRSGSIGWATRAYGQAGLDKSFIDSFPAFAKQGCRVCGVEIQMTGIVNQGSQNNDGIAVIGASKPGIQNNGAPSWTWNFPVLGSASLAQVSGAFTKTISISGANWSSWLLAAPNPSLDIFAQDDTTVHSVVVTYYTY